MSVPCFTVLRRTLPAIIAAAIPFAAPGSAAAQNIMPEGAPPAPGARIKTAAPAPTKEPLDPERLAAMQRPRDHAPAAPKAPVNHAAVDRFRLDRVVFDEPGDGALWAAGQTYKARFDTSGFTYIPKFGPEAPRNFPIAFVLKNVTVGGQQLPLQPASPVRHGESVHFNRGAVTESYALALESLEQTFKFNTRPAGSGDLVIHMAIDTELAMTENANGFVFGHAQGSVTYSSAVVVDAAGQRTNVSTRLENVGGVEHGAKSLEIALPDSLLASAAWPIVVDPILQTNLVEAVSRDRWPDVAYDRTTDTFCIALEADFSATDGDIWTVRVNGTTGALIGPSLTPIDLSTTNWRRPKIANNFLNNNYLVVAEVGFAPNRVIWGRTVATSSDTTSAQFMIGDPINYPGDEVHCDVGGDPDDQAPVYYFVLWQNEFSATDHDVLGRLVTPGAAINGSVIEVDYSVNDDINPAISKGDPNLVWAIAWERKSSSGNHDIYGARRFWNGNLVDGPFEVDTSSSDNRNPRVSSPMFDGANAYVYEENPSTSGDTWCRVMHGTSIVASQNLTALDGVSARTRLPVVDANSSQFVVAYEEQFDGSDWDAYASTYCYLPTSIDVAERHRRLAYEVEPEGSLMVASKYSAGGAPTGALIAWVRLYGNGFGDLTDAMYQIPASCCPEDVNRNGVINVDDLIAVINGWGLCVNCNADIDGNALVNVNDLLALINAWGPCS